MTARKDFRIVRNKFANDSGLPFGKILTREYVLSVLESEGHSYRQRTFCPLVTLWAWLSQCTSQDKSIREAVTRVLANRVVTGLPACSASTCAYSKARDRFPLAVMKRLAIEVGRNIHNGADDAWHWRGRQVFLADGTGLSMPDTPELQAVFPQPSTQKPGVGFPLMRTVALISLTTGAVVDIAFGKYAGKGRGEGGLFRRMFGSLSSGDIVVADKLYPSYFSIDALQKRGVDMVSMSHAGRKVDFSEGTILGKNDHIVSWRKPVWRRGIDRAWYESVPKTIPVREFEIEVEGRDGKPTKAIVVTTLIDATIPQEEIAALYWKRWNCEIDLRSIKQSMHLDILRCKTPEMVIKEIYCHILAWNLLRGTMTEAAKRNGVLPRQLSFKGTMQAIESFTPAMMAASEAGEVLYNAMLTTVAAHRVGTQPGRQEVRLLKRRPAWRQHCMMKPRNEYYRKPARKPVPLS